jgi:hypothetical protein
VEVAAFLPQKKNNSKIYAAVALVLILLGAVVIYFSLNLVLSSLNQTEPGSLAPARVAHWAGYLVSLDIQNRSQGVSGISASWIVPEVQFSENNTFSSVWVGVGGYGEESLIQAGTEQHCFNGKIEYFAWYELLPAYIVRTQSVNVQPGDTVVVSINLLNQDQSTWQITIDNLSNGNHFEKTNIFYDSSQQSAEWIVERPTVENVISNLANFGNVTLTNCTATINGVNGSIKDFIYAPTIMVDSANNPLTSTSALSGDGSSFSVNYLSSSLNATLSPSTAP